jgi:hypothetical protein
VQDEDRTERSKAGSYEPPTIVTLGSIEDFTAGDSGSGTLDGRPQP